MRFSQENKEILKKLYKLKAELKPMVKSAENPFFDSTYADLNSILAQVEPVVHELGLLLTQGVHVHKDHTVVVTKFTDVESGEYAECEMPVITPKQDMQSIGAGVTYARRITLKAGLGLQEEDDDGNKASGRVVKKSKKKSKVKDDDSYDAKDEF